MFRNREHAAHADKIDELKAEIGDLKREVSSEKQSLRLTERVNGLKQEIAQLEIDRDKKQEDFNRRERETEHKVGLLLKQQEFEVVKAKRETELEVRESNLAAEKTRFEQEMKFMRERMEKEVDYVKEIAEKILARLPDISASLKVTNNGHQDREEVEV